GESSTVFSFDPGTGGQSLIPFQNGLLFTDTSDPYRRYWFTDGTAGGTSLIAQNGRGIPTVLGERIFFSGYDPDSGTELWISDGTPQGAHLVVDLNIQGASSSPSDA